MTSPEKTNAGNAIAKQIYAKAALAKIILTPEAYAVWYAYYARDNEALVAELDSITASAVKIDDKEHNRLFDKYLRAQEGESLVQAVQQETQKIIQSVFKEIMGANANVTQYGSKMEKYSQTLSQSKDLSQIRQIMREVVQDTQSMADNSRALQIKLEAATAKTKELQNQLQQTQEEASVDALTGLKNRKAFDEKLTELFKVFSNKGTYFSSIMLDIDHFKRFNDDFGHQVGDLVLRTVGGIILKSLKGQDFPARYGGEEFIALLPETSLDNAIIVAEQLRLRISLCKPADPATGKPYRQITASLGVSFISRSDTIKSVIERADKALYFAKESGRNNVKSEKDLP